MRALLFILLNVLSFSISAQTLNVYNWADYLPAKVIAKFEKETGISINYTEYDSNETLYSKLKSNPNIGYDVIFPSSYFVDRMRRENRLSEIDKTQIPNLKNIAPHFLNQKFDPSNTYSVPYLWGASGIVVNKRYIPVDSITRWEDFWRPEFYNKLLVFDDEREIFAIALLTLGYSINETNPQHIYEAFRRLQQLLPNIKLFNQEAQQNIYIDEDVVIGMGFNGEIYNAIKENPSLHFIYPKEGFELWMDCIAIPKNAPHKAAAHQFINFLLRPDIAKEITLALGFSTPNQEALKMLPASFRHNPILNPDPITISRGQYLIDVGETNNIYDYYWYKLKIG